MDSKEKTPKWYCTRIGPATVEVGKPDWKFKFNVETVSLGNQIAFLLNRGDTCAKDVVELMTVKTEMASALKEAYEALDWMMVNMRVENPSLQSDSFNIPANAMTKIQTLIESH